MIGFVYFLLGFLLIGLGIVDVLWKVSCSVCSLLCSGCVWWLLMFVVVVVMRLVSDLINLCVLFRFVCFIGLLVSLIFMVVVFIRCMVIVLMILIVGILVMLWVCFVVLVKLNL